MTSYKTFLTFIFVLLSVFSCKKNTYASNSNISDSIKSIRKTISSFDFKNNPANGNLLLSGDSTIADQFNGVNIKKLFYSTGTITNIAVPGNTIEQQFISFIKLNKSVKLNADFVILQVGLNNIEAIMANDGTIESTKNIMQMYINKIKLDCPKAKIIVSAILPANKRWDVIFKDQSFKAKLIWKQINSIFPKLDNIDAFVDDHINIISDGNNNLDPTYEAINPYNNDPDHIHENNAGRKVIAYYWLLELKKLEIKK